MFENNNQNSYGSWNTGGVPEEQGSKNSPAPYANWSYGGDSAHRPADLPPARDESTLYGQKLYNTYQPEGSSTPTPPRKEKKPKKERRGGRSAGLVAAVLALALMGGAAGGGATAWWMTAQAQTAASPVVSDAPEPQSSTAATPQAAASLPASTTGGDITAVVEKAGPSVVEIRLSSTVMTFFGEATSESAGSGVIYSEDGYIITNNHVIEQGGNVVVVTQDGAEYAATLVGTDPKTDLAVIKIDATGLTPATFADSDSVQVGQLTVAIGNPLGTLGGSVTDGVVSAKDREITIGDQTMVLMQTSAAINPGNSGGGLFDGNGNLIGVVNAKSSGLEIEGLGFAIPSNTAKAVAEDLVEHGYVTGRPELGIQVLQVSDIRTANYYGFSEYGVYIMETTRNNGLKAGDRIISINGNMIETASDVSEAVTTGKVGDVLSFVIERRGQVMELEVTILEQLPDSMKEEISAPAEF